MEITTRLETVVLTNRASIEDDDLRELLPLVAKIDPQVVLEIGMHQGYSMEIWRKAFDPLMLIGIEKDLPTFLSYVTEETMLWRTDSHSERTQVHVEVFLQKRLVDFLFIDGDHSYEGVKQDFEMYAPFVRKGGIIALHDVDYVSEDPASPVMVKPFWNEIKKNYRHHLIKKGKNSTGMGVLFT